jgi:ketosteroid isomerase-like protein
MSRPEVDSALAEFLEAFDNLEWDRFCACFAEHATVYLPFETHPHIVVGKSEVEAGFAPLFEERRLSEAGPPYLHLEPADTSVSVYSDLAFVTFHLSLPGAIGRRTIIFCKRDGTWKIVHLHASAMSA